MCRGWKGHKTPAVCWVVILSALLCGCTLGPKQINASRQQYNEAIQQTFQEEMLLNLVRLRYREPPEFVAIGGIAAQYEFDGGTSVGADLVEGGPNLLGIGGTVHRSERPTITYAPLRDPDFNRGLLSPVCLETLGILAATGWRWDRIFRTMIRSMNRVENARSAGGPTPDVKPEFEQFRYLSHLLRCLHTQRNAEFAFARRKVRTPCPLPPKNIDTDFVLAALEKGYEIEQQGDRLFVVQEEQYTALIINPNAVYSPEMRQIVSMLDLEAGRSRYEVKLALEGQIQPAFFDPDDRPERLAPLDRTVDKRIERLPVPPRSREEITVQTRSILEMMFYLSQGIQIPAEHVQQGLVTLTVDHAGRPFNWAEMTGDLLQVHVSAGRPGCAAVAIPHRGYWYYIDDRDLNSQATFFLLMELFFMEIRGGGAARLPVLTLGLN